MAERWSESGQKPEKFIQSRTWNRMLDIQRNQSLQRLGGQGGGPLDLSLGGPVEVLVRNDTGASAAPGYVLAITGTPLDPVGDALTFEGRPCFTGGAPASTSDAVVVLLDGAAPGEVVRGVLMGVAVCLVNLTSTGHGYATPTASDASQLTSAATGPIRLLWTSNAGHTGQQTAVVALGTGTPGGSTAAGARRKSAGETLTTINGPAIVLTFPVAHFDTSGFFNASDGYTRITAPADGYYVFGASVAWSTPSALYDLVLAIEHYNPANELIATLASVNAISQGSGVIYASLESLTAGTVMLAGSYIILKGYTPSTSAVDATTGPYGSSAPTITSESCFWIGGMSGTVATGGGGGTVTNVTASSPLASSGGGAPNISLTVPGDATKFLNGTGNFTVPAGSGGSGQTYVATLKYGLP